ncbi:MAG: hypothetical protein OXJ52_08885, partial [Oligoflexia bacterium]|nr:hypothetical protein [Oligoflexia bacterium]
MARLVFSKTPKKYKDYQDYKPWLESKSYPKFCGYSWLIDQQSLWIVPKNWTVVRHHFSYSS